MNARETAQWKREFDELGAEKVRSDLILGRWDKEKRIVARQWLELSDTRTWQADRPPEGSPRGGFILNKRNAKWWGYATAAFFLIFGIMRLWRRW
jgi:hypothetical protein